MYEAKRFRGWGGFESTLLSGYSWCRLDRDEVLDQLNPRFQEFPFSDGKTVSGFSFGYGGKNPHRSFTRFSVDDHTLGIEKL